MSSTATVQLTKKSLPIVGSKNINQKSLPQDVVQTVGKVRLQVVDVFSQISAFFNVLKNWIFGNSKSFKEDYENLALETAYAKKLSLYSDKKLKPDEKDFLKFIGQDIASFEDLNKIQKKIKNVSNLSKAIKSKASKVIIEDLLKNIKAEIPENYIVVLKSAKRWAIDLKASKEIKDLLNSELIKVESKPKTLEIPRKVETPQEETPQKEIKQKEIKQEKAAPKVKEGLTTMQKILFGGAAASGDRKSTRLNSSHIPLSRMPSSA